MKNKQLHNGVYKVSKKRLDDILSALRKEGNIFVADLDAYHIHESFAGLAKYYGIPEDLLIDNDYWVDEVVYWPASSDWLKEHKLIGYAFVLRNFPVDEDNRNLNYYKFVARYLQGNIELWGEGTAVPFNVFIEMPLAANRITAQQAVDSYRNFKAAYIDDPNKRSRQIQKYIFIALLILGWLLIAVHEIGWFSHYFFAK